MPAETHGYFDKIRSESLREDARSESPSPRTVIVEVDVPVPRVAAAPAGRGGRGTFSHKRRFRLVAPDADLDDGIAAVRQALADVVGGPAGRYLPTSNAFIVDMTGKQLRQIAAMPMVRAIYPNTVRR